MSNDPLVVTKETIMFTAEASSLFWEPGYRAETFMYLGLEFSLVAAETNDNGDITRWIYWNNSARRHAIVFND